MDTIKERAKELINHGFSVLPLEGKKPVPGFSWKEYQSRVMGEQDVDTHFSTANGLGVICGKVSGNLEVLDFDLKHDKSGTLFERWRDAVQGSNPELWSALERSLVRTRNGGWHLYYYCDSIEGNKVLAKGEDGTTLIETRGEGGYVVAPPSEGYFTPSDEQLDITSITPDERKFLHDTAEVFSWVESPRSTTSTTGFHTANEVTPWDDYNSRTSNVTLLQSFGWTVVRTDGKRTYLKRPGDTDSESSGNVHHDTGLFYCHSTSTELPAGKGLTPHAVLTYLMFGGDFRRSASYLQKMGYGHRSTTMYDLRDHPPAEVSVSSRLPSGNDASLLSRLEACRVHTGMELTKPAPFITVKDSTISTLGNITTFIGPSKAGKSALIQAGLAGCFNRDGFEVDTLGMNVTPSDGKLILHLDTEQSTYDHWRGIKAAVKRAGLESEPAYFQSFNITGYSGAESLELLNFALEHYGKQFGGVHSIWLDGPADFVSSVNDEQAVNSLLTHLQMTARHHSCPVILTLHFNPNSENKGRGHLGSALERKSESVLSVTKDADEVSRYEPLKGLLRNAGGFPSFRFRYSESKGYHESLSFELTRKERSEMERSELVRDVASIFQGGSVSFTYSDLCKALVDHYVIKTDTAKRKIKSLLDAGILQKSDSSKPVYSLKGGLVDGSGLST